jgi:DnaK suppressor protein
MEVDMTTITLTHDEEIAAHLDEFRDMLEDQRRFRLDQLNPSADPLTGRQVDALDTSADNARIEVSAAVKAAARQALDDIESALARLSTGRYGRCTGCAASIPVERLLAIPQAPLCMHCQRRAEHRR